MNCKICGKPAEIKIQKHSNGKTRVLWLCRECGAKRGFLPADQGTGLDTVLGGLLGVIEEWEKEERRCTDCGTTLAELRNTQEAGCIHCFTRFRTEIVDMVRATPQVKSHAGRLPPRFLHLRTFFVDRERLRKRLDKAIATENYEMAAKVRDELMRIEGHKDA